MFLDNKYTNWYFNIIRKSTDRSKLCGYTEKHHIIPKSLGGSDDVENLVDLTAREHFICHLLLPRMVVGNFHYKMICALWAMSTLRNRYHNRVVVPSRIYENVKKQKAKAMSEMYSGVSNPFYGKTHSEETKEKMRSRVVSDNTRDLMSLRQTERYTNMPGTFLGKTHSELTKEKIRQSRIGKKDSAEVRLKKSIAGKNKPPVSEETRKKISASNKGRSGFSGEMNGFFGKTHSIEQREKKRQEKLGSPRLTCSHCSKIVDIMNFKRWHDDNCKHKK